MNVIIVGYMGFDGPGVMHAHHFANGLVGEGHNILLLINGDKRTAGLMSEPPRYRLEQIGFEDGFLAPDLLTLAKQFPPDLVHIWTPRHVPARVGLELAVATGARLVIHFEDDEEVLLRHFGGNARFASDDVAFYRLMARETLDADRLAALALSVNAEFLRATLLNPGLWFWLHPVASAVAVRYADAYTFISQSYRDVLELPRNKPSLLLYPGVDRDRFAPGYEPELRERLGLEDRTILVYSGAIADVHDFSAYLKALPEVVRQHPDVMLVQVGRNDIKAVTDSIVKALDLSRHVLFAGAIPHYQMPLYLAMADAFLAPVRHDDFNKHRLPSKIPEYMSVGRPMLIMNWGFGRVLEPEDGVVKVYSDEPGEVARGLLALLDLRDDWTAMGSRLRDRSATFFDWKRNTGLLADFYQRVLDYAATDRAEGLEDSDAPVTLEATGYRSALETPVSASHGPSSTKLEKVSQGSTVGGRDGRHTDANHTDRSPAGDCAGGSLDPIASDPFGVERALRAEVQRLSLTLESLEVRHHRTLEMLKVAEVQIGLLRKIPLLSPIWRLVRRVIYPDLKG
ncbi:MAG TPA: glycosyltransferase [Vicinamibacteria bacterium]|nr:glycosyltransferase [Vicinamibacteria bacterium]